MKIEKNLVLKRQKTLLIYHISIYVYTLLTIYTLIRICSDRLKKLSFTVFSKQK